MRFFKCKALGLLIASVLVASSFSLIASAASEEETHVVILATSDLHGNIWGYSYEDNTETTNNGMARLYTYIQQVREENPIVFLVDAGDDIQGTIMTDDLANKEPDKEHPVIAAMNYMGFDSMTLGNHEFNWGIDTMNKILGQASFPVLGANILDQDGNYVTGNGYVILEKGGVKLAIIGVCTPDIPIWDGGKDGIDETTYEAANVAVKKAIEEIGDQADIILVSAHVGQYAEFDEEGGSDSGEKIVEDNPEVDILQIAHMHVTVNDKIGDTTMVGVRNAGREIARVDVTLDADKNITDISAEIVDMEGYEPSEEIREIPVVKELHEQTINFIQGIGPDGEQSEPLGLTTAKFQPENEILGLPEGKLQDTAVIDLILKIQLENSGADVTACALFKDTSDLPEGAINYGNIFDIYKFDNTLYALDVTGAELKGYMEWSAECYNQWQPGDINISFDPEYPGYLYDMFAGVDYEINLSKPKGERIENVMFKGEPLQDDQILKLAVNNYRYSSAIKSQNLAEGNHTWESSNSIRDMIVDYFAENSPVEPTVDENWHITGVDLSEDDPRREEIIGYINEGLLATPYNESYNLENYDALVAEAEANKEAGETAKEHESH
ncbi:MAG: 5'-nucleotidase C-terminal domain-containing protein [Blautia sp.]|nr:5'-nucleotidase C-terminal domain-containing protein [Blautia sp.]